MQATLIQGHMQTFTGNTPYSTSSYSAPGGVMAEATGPPRRGSGTFGRTLPARGVCLAVVPAVVADVLKGGVAL
jgi:hypothetical protein